VLRQSHHRASEQFQRPARSTGGRRRARGRDEKRLLLLGQLPVGARTRELAQRGVEPLFNEPSFVRNTVDVPTEMFCAIAASVDPASEASRI
jgi:hypothetical protein